MSGEENGQGSKPVELKKGLTDTIVSEILIPALSMGMREADFWASTPRQIMRFFKANELKEKRELSKMDALGWTVGSYVCSAISACISKDFKYPSKPYSVQKEEDENISEEDRKLVERLRLMQLQRKIKDKENR